ncbi:hypothetical protein [Microbacterium sp. NPDC087589]|uniref:hypothetical protein n=1 Tax=Microbacterium sp. NPDC087589 TaxID=3364191 RepID=UPI0037F2727B
MTVSTANSFSESVAEFESSAPWLGAPHMPALVTLRKLAEALDGGALTPALVAQFGLTYRNLAKLAPAATGEESPLEKALREAAQS